MPIGNSGKGRGLCPTFIGFMLRPTSYLGAWAAGYGSSAGVALQRSLRGGGVMSGKHTSRRKLPNGSDPVEGQEIRRDQGDKVQVTRFLWDHWHDDMPRLVLVFCRAALPSGWDTGHLQSRVPPAASYLANF